MNKRDNPLLWVFAGFGAVLLAGLLMFFVNSLGPSPAPVVSQTRPKAVQQKPQPKLATKASIRPKIILQKQSQPKATAETSFRSRVSVSGQRFRRSQSLTSTVTILTRSLRGMSNPAEITLEPSQDN